MYDEFLEQSGIINIDKNIDFLIEFRIEETRKRSFLDLDKILNKL